MTEIINNSRPVFEIFSEFLKKEGSYTYALTMKELHDLFVKQAELDESKDKPKLGKTIFRVIDQGVNIKTFYTVSDLKKPEGRVGLTIEGVINNNNKGILSGQTEAKIRPNLEIKERVLKEFDVEDSLSMATFLKSMIEDPFKGKMNILNMSLKEEKLVINFEKSKKV